MARLALGLCALAAAVNQGEAAAKLSVEKRPRTHLARKDAGAALLAKYGNGQLAASPSLPINNFMVR